MVEQNIGRELGWDDEIVNDSEFIILPEGDYDFQVISWERGRHNGSDKLPPCNKAVVKIKITGEKGSITLDHQLFLHTVTEGLLCTFFTAIGQRQKGEKLSMNWQKVVGSTGRCQVYVSSFISNKTGEELQSNKIKKFYPKETKDFVEGEF